MTKERPILFSAPMVRALLDGRKTQTRRAVKPHDLDWMDQHQGMREPCNAERCPHGQPSDRLWVREAHYLTDDGHSEYAVYAADDGAAFEHQKRMVGLSADFPADVKANHKRLRPSIHMPRWASRIDLEITAVRVERLQDITRGDCMAEGCHFPNLARQTDPKQWYADLWQSINGPGSWAQNPLGLCH